MGKLVKFLLMSIMVLATLAMAGCGEEKKYNEMKNALVPQINAAMKLTDKDVNVLEKKNAAAWADIKAKVAEMQKLATSDTKLNNDLLNFQKYVAEREDAATSAIKSRKVREADTADIKAKGGERMRW